MPELIAALIPAVLAIIGVLIFIGRTLGKLDSLVSAVKKLSDSLDKFTEKTTEVLQSQDKRIQRLEDRMDWLHKNKSTS